MKSLIDVIEESKKKLDNNLLSHRLSSQNISTKDKLQCIPLLSFFVLGFKDCMNLLHTTDPQNELEKVINTHSEEDSFHWQWFLQDLDSLNVDGIYDKRATAVLEELWSDQRAPIREMVYTVTHYIKRYTEPALRLVLIEVVESGYAAFTRYMSPVMQEAGLYDQLLYFGHTHNDAEAEHDLYQAPEEIALAGIIENLSDVERIHAQEMVVELYKKLEAMHHCFALSIPFDKK